MPNAALAIQSTCVDVLPLSSEVLWLRTDAMEVPKAFDVSSRTARISVAF